MNELPLRTVPRPDPGDDTFRHFVGVAVAAALLWGPVWILTGVREIGGAILLAGAGLAAVYLGRRRLGPALATHLAVALAVAAIFGVVVMTGGIAGTRGAWVFTLPVAVALALGVRGAAVWGGGVLAAVVVLWMLELRGFSFPDRVPAEHHTAEGAGVHLTALTVILLLSMTYARTRAATVRSLAAVSADREQWAQRLEVLVDVARTLASERSPDRLYRAFYVQVGRVLRRDAFYVALWDEATQTIRYPLLFDEGTEYPGERVSLGDGPTSRAIRERRTVVWRDHPFAEGIPFGSTGRVSAAAIHAPLVKDGRVLGVVAVFSYEGEYSAEDVRLFESLADQAAVAVENATLYRKARESEAGFREVLAAIERMVGHAVVITDPEGRITYAAGTEGTHGYPPAELVGEHVSLLGRGIPEEERSAADFLRPTLEGRPWTGAVRATRRSGENFPILISASPYYGPDGEVTGVVTIGIDLTEQVEAQRRVLQSAKLAAIGELVAGVAHELNNPLTVVKTTAHLLERELQGAAAEDARSIREHADRAARIVRGLLHFARQAPHERAATDLNEVVGRVCRFRKLGMAANRVELECHLDPRLPLTLADASQLEQVILNLLNNAELAIASGPGWGTVTVTTEAEGGTVRLHVADDGPGIPEEIQGRLFEPFFTTRPVGEGTGLGLAVSHGIVAEHGGSIRVRSEPGRGAVFTVELPVVAPEERAASAPVAEKRRPAPRRVLVVDDEPELRRIVRRFLAARGHQVEEAASGAEALARVEEGSYDVLLLDLKMPGATGEEVYRALVERRPQLARRVVFATGDVISPARKRFLEGTGQPVFEKPYDLEELARAVEREG